MLVTAAVERDQIIHHRPTFLARPACRFSAGNELTTLMNQIGEPGCLLSLGTYDRNH